MEAVEPTVRAILDDVVLRDDGVQYIDNFASWIVRLRERPARQTSRIFVQLSFLAGQFLDAGSPSLAGSLAVLARIGLRDRSDAAEAAVSSRDTQLVNREMP
jgi:hypothetical protein